MRAVVPTIALLFGLAVHAARLEAQGTIVVLARHAEKASSSGDPGLTSAGQARAQALADALQHFRLDGVVVSQFRRTQATAAIAAAARGLVPIVVPVGPTVVAHAESVAAAARRFPPHSAVLVVGHSNTLGPIIVALGGPATSDLCDAEYATMFVLTTSEEGAPARLLRTTVGAPDPATATACPQLPAPIPPVQGQPLTAFALRYIDIAVGVGQPVRPRQCIYAHYTGWLTDGTKFDSSRDTLPVGTPRPPFAFPQGTRRVIAGWDAGFEGMAVGGRRRLLIPYQLAYGELGRPPVIPPRAGLIFDVEVMAVADTLPRTDAAPAQAAAGPRCPAWTGIGGAATP